LCSGHGMFLGFGATGVEDAWKMCQTSVAGIAWPG